MTCACGCGLEVKPYVYRGRSIPVRYRRGHNARGAAKSAEQRAKVAWTRQRKHFVPVAPIRALLRKKGIGPAELGRRMGVSRNVANNYYYQRREWMMRSTAERILRALADLPREASLSHRRLTDERLVLQRKERKAEARRAERAGKAS